MKKLFLVILLVVMAAGLAYAQGNNSTGPTDWTPTVDVFGAHLNGGRGCAGCHAPHSGGRSSGNFGAGSGAGINGDSALWGTDVTPLLGQTISFGAEFPVTFASDSAGWSDPQFKHIATCLSCHDGNISKNGMMAGRSWEQANGVLDVFTAANGAHYYGTGPIPTLLGNDGAGAGDYNNDHPVGPAANMYAVLKTAYTGNVTVTAASGKTSITVTPVVGSAYEKFALNYQNAALSAMRKDSTETDGGKAYVVCTTCHQQHNMVVYKGTAGNVTGKFKTYFFVKGPYNPGAVSDANHTTSTMQFCRQCHFSMSNEAYGLNTIGTAF